MRVGVRVLVCMLTHGCQSLVPVQVCIYVCVRVRVYVVLRMRVCVCMLAHGCCSLVPAQVCVRACKCVCACVSVFVCAGMCVRARL